MQETESRPLIQIHGRGAAHNPPNRFVQMDFVPDYEHVDPDDEPAPRTVFLRDATRTIIARNDSPDVGFDASVNPYRGCEHGCLYSRFRGLDNLRVPSIVRRHLGYL